MTIERAVELQQKVHALLAQHFSTIPVVDAPSPGMKRHIRIDGFTMVDAPDYRNFEKTTHRFFVHAFELETRSLLWVKNTLAAVHGVMRTFAMDGATPPRLEEANSFFEPRTDGQLNAHGFIRYITTIGEQ